MQRERRACLTEFVGEKVLVKARADASLRLVQLQGARGVEEGVLHGFLRARSEEPVEVRLLEETRVESVSDPCGVILIVQVGLESLGDSRPKRNVRHIVKRPIKQPPSLLLQGAVEVPLHASGEVVLDRM